MWRAVRRLSTAFAILGLLSATSHAAWPDCSKGDDVDRRLTACTAIIEGNDLGQRELSAAYTVRASLYLAKNQFDLAIEDLAKAIELDPAAAPAYDLRGAAFHRMGKFDRAIEDFNEAIRRNPKFLTAYSNRGHAYLAIGERELAMADFRKVLELPGGTKQLEFIQNLARSSVEKLTQAKDLNPDPDPALSETIVKVPLSLRLPNGAEHHGEFVLTTFKPRGPGPFPAVIVSHGHSGVLRTMFGRNRILWSYFMQRGFAVLAPTRIGHGVSSIPIDPESPRLPVGVVPQGSDGGCDLFDFRLPVGAGSAHILATIEYASNLSWVDKNRIVLVGGSAGGLYSLVAAGTAASGIKAVVNFSGGAGGLATRPEHPCNPGNVKALLSAAGKNNSIPTIWFYSENDKNFGAEIPRAWHDAYVSAGGRAEFHMLPPLGEDGHNIIGPGTKYWLPLLDEFLTMNGFKPRQLPADAPPPTGFAPIGDTSKVPLVDDKGRAAYAIFLRQSVLRAFAIGPDGFWAYSAGKFDALAEALARCGQNGRRVCKLYAVNDDVVW